MATAVNFDFLNDVKKIGFLGFGRSNKALFEYLKRRFEFHAVIRDEREALDGAPAGAELLLEKNCFKPAFEDVIFLSPSVRRERECVRHLSRHSLLSSDAELFFSSGHDNVFAITGSDGKSTTAALTGKILNTGGTKAFVCGNFGLPLTPLSDEQNAYFVTELSSFMLRYMTPKSRRALITNITPNHLNWHADFEEYKSSKESILKNAEERVFSFDCPQSRELIKKYGAYAVFSVNMPYGELKKALKAELYASLEDGFITLNGVKIAERKKLPVVGIHNVKNVLSALCLTHGFCDTGSALEAIFGFSGLEHRCKLIYESNGIRYYDSSIDSSPERTRATLKMFERPVTVILGGRDKNLDYAPLSRAVMSHAGAVILCGENAEKIFKFLKDGNAPCPIFKVENYREAVLRAREIGLDTVLSPASTSFDCFKNFEERGDAFLEAIRQVYK